MIDAHKAALLQQKAEEERLARATRLAEMRLRDDVPLSMGPETMKYTYKKSKGRGWDGGGLLGGLSSFGSLLSSSVSYAASPPAASPALASFDAAPSANFFLQDSTVMAKPAASNSSSSEKKDASSSSASSSSSSSSSSNSSSSSSSTEGASQTTNTPDPSKTTPSASSSSSSTTTSSTDSPLLAPRDLTKIPIELDAQYEALDTESALHATTITPDGDWTKKAWASILATQPTTRRLNALQATERGEAFDLIDALSRSGALPLEHAALHVIIGASHTFDKSLVDTVIQDNVNPIERTERSLLIMATTLHEKKAIELVRTDQVQRLKDFGSAALIEDA